MNLMAYRKELIASIGVGLMIFGAATMHIGFGMLMIGVILLISRAYMDAEGGDDWKQDVKTPDAPIVKDPLARPWEQPVAPTDPLPEQWKEVKGPTA